MPTLVSIAYSPWSIRTRFALDAMGVRYEKRAYIPVLSEPRLRFGLRRFTGKVTVPVMFLDDGTVLDDSLDIVLWANSRSDRPLVPEGEVDTVRTWNGVAEVLLAAGRLRTTRRLQNTPEALSESLPSPIRMLGPVGMVIGRDATRRLLEKYPADDTLDRMTEALGSLRAALTRGEDRPVAPTDRLITDRLTYADITCAVGLSFVKPHDKHPLGPVSRQCWTEPDLADHNPDLLQWRDAVMAEARALR